LGSRPPRSFRSFNAATANVLVPALAHARPSKGSFADQHRCLLHQRRPTPSLPAIYSFLGTAFFWTSIIRHIQIRRAPLRRDALHHDGPKRYCPGPSAEHAVRQEPGGARHQHPPRCVPGHGHTSTGCRDSHQQSSLERRQTIRIHANPPPPQHAGRRAPPEAPRGQTAFLRRAISKPPGAYRREDEAAV
jgi:hypothetical protein